MKSNTPSKIVKTLGSRGPTKETKDRKSGKIETPPPEKERLVRRVRLETQTEIKHVVRIAINDLRQGLITHEKARAIFYGAQTLFQMNNQTDIQEQMNRIEALLKRSPTYARQPV